MAFFLGLVLFVRGGAELFAGNALITLALTDKNVSTNQLLTNLSLVYLRIDTGSTS